jgi:hypothetical protein
MRARTIAFAPTIRRLSLAAVLFLLPASLGYAQTNIIGGGMWGDAKKPAAQTLSLDGTAHGETGSAASITATLSTTKTNDIIIAVVAENACGTDISVSDSPGGLSWTRRAPSSPSGNTIYEFYAVSSGALSSDVITASCTGGNYVEIWAFGVNDAHTAAPYDTNGALPFFATSGNASITTSNANDFLIAAFRSGGSSCATSGFATVIAGVFGCVEYSIVSATQSSLSVSAPSGTNGTIGDAIIKGP